MMHLANHQETEPHCTDPASLADDLSKYWAGWNLAASMESVTRLHQARDLHTRGPAMPDTDARAAWELMNNYGRAAAEALLHDDPIQNAIALAHKYAEAKAEWERQTAGAR